MNTLPKPLQIVLTLVAVFAIGAFAAGCGSDDDTTSDAAPATDTPPPASPDEAGVTVDVDAVDNKFDPAEVTVNAGEAVRWTNQDSVAHDVTSDDGTLAGVIPNQGSEFSHTFSEPGTYAYTCKLHPGMDGTVVVE